ncbi:uncharacterized protein LOC144476732 isoform X3 [Augochlora pura]
MYQSYRGTIIRAINLRRKRACCGSIGDRLETLGQQCTHAFQGASLRLPDLPVMVPVSSTVIPLPVYKVVYNLGVLSKDKKTQSSFKPEGAVKLITNKKGQEKKT